MKPLNGVRVLVVDDSADNLLLVETILSNSGASVVTADCGNDALSLVPTNHFDIVLMDLQMPMMNGYQTKSALDALGFDKPVIALTAHASDEEKVKTYEAGFIGHLTKPLSRVDVLALLSACLPKT